MWISIIGPDGSGKTLISSSLKNLGFRLVGDTTSFDVDYYYNLDKDCSLNKNNDNIFTIGSFWDFHECKLAFQHRLYKMTDAEKKMADNLYLERKNQVAPPTFVVYTKITKQFARDRLLLTGDSEELLQNIDIQLQLYEDFIQRVSCPVIEVDMSRGERVYEDLQFGIDSISATRLHEQSIWNSEMMRSR